MVHSTNTPEYMNATSHHSKMRVTVNLSSSLFVAGDEVTGKMDMECRADSGVGLGLIMVELFAIQELNSRDHSATSTFLHSRRLYQGPGIPPSNAVYPHTSPGQDPLPQGHFPARRGVTTFFFQFPLPVSSPSAISFASGLARVRYEVRASVSVAHRGEKRLVTDVAAADVVQCQDMDGAVASHVVVGENGKVYIQGRVVGGRFVSGKQGCVEFHVKNHSAKRTTGLSLSLTRALHLPDTTGGSRPPLQITDTLISQNYRGAEYTVQPGAEGVATLVFDVPKAARVVKGGFREGSTDGSLTAPLFELRCILSIRVGMAAGSKEVLFEMPVQLSHPATLPTDLSLSSPEAMQPPNPHFVHPPGSGSDPSSPAYRHNVSSDPQVPPLLASSPSPHAQPPHPAQYPLSTPYYHPATMYPPPNIWSPLQIPYLASPPDPHHQYYFPPPPTVLVPFAHPARPSSAGAQPPTPTALPGVGIAEPSGLPGVGSVLQTFRSQPHDPTEHKDPKSESHSEEQASSGVTEAEEGKGARASRIAQHLRAPARARSASPTAHRFPGSAAAAPAEGAQTMHAVPSNSPAALYATTPRNSAAPPILSPRPVRTPRQSISPIAEPGMTARSERVDLLERLVDTGEESKSVAEVLQDLERDKTLPAPPVPTGKVRAEKLPRARDLFAQRGKVGGKELTVPPTKSVLRPSPVARALDNRETVRSHHNVAAASLMPAGSGLDALEKRLVQEVGTRKPDKPERPTILSPPTSAPVEATSSSPVHSPRTPTLPPQSMQRDSQISEIAIPLASSHANLDASSSKSPRKETKDSTTPRVEADRSRTRTTPAARGKDKDSPRTHETKTRQNEALQLRKEAKGRVATWLEAVAVPSDKGKEEAKVVGASEKASDERGDNGPADGMETPRANQLASSSPTASSPLNNLSPQAERHKRSQGPVVTKDGKEKARSNQITSQTPPALSKPSTPSKRPVSMSPPRRPILSKDHAPPIAEEQVSSKSPTRIPKLKSSPMPPEAKYDFRSARGGRGGITTSVAAIWTSMANERNEAKPGKPISKPAAAVPGKRPAFLDVGKANPTPTSVESTTTKPKAPGPSSSDAVEQKQQHNPIKSTSVPAAVNTSVAKPHITSSASLARPPVDASSKGKQPPLNPLKEVRRPPAPVKSEFAFGQARLKDLIKKYQQDAS